MELIRRIDNAVYELTMALKEVERLEVGWVDAAELLAIKTKLTEAFWNAQHAQHVTRYLTADTAGILD